MIDRLLVVFSSGFGYVAKLNLKEEEERTPLDKINKGQVSFLLSLSSGMQDDMLVEISSVKGLQISTELRAIPLLNLGSSGVKLIKMEDGDTVSSVRI